MAVYLIHFNRPLQHARHYLGFTDNLADRLESHRQGRGARLIQVITEQGIDWVLARVWPEGDRKLERQLKNRKESPRLCPICQNQKNLENPLDNHGTPE